MPRKTKRHNRIYESEEQLTQPSALSLVAHISRALISDGMAWLFVPATIVAFYLHRHHILNDAWLAVIFCMLTLVALVRGCINWQGELKEYQRDLALQRHRQGTGPGHSIQGYYSGRRY